MNNYERLNNIRVQNEGTIYNIYKIDNTYGGSDFVEVFPITKQYRHGNSRSTHSSPQGMDIKVTRIKDIKDKINQLDILGYTDIKID